MGEIAIALSRDQALALFVLLPANPSAAGTSPQ